APESFLSVLRDPFRLGRGDSVSRKENLASRIGAFAFRLAIGKILGFDNGRDGMDARDVARGLQVGRAFGGLRGGGIGRRRRRGRSVQVRIASGGRGLRRL